MDKLVRTYDLQVIKKSFDGGDIVISTGSPDRYKDRVLPKGMRAENFMKNPVVVWGHNYVSPWALIGHATRLKAMDAGIESSFVLRPSANDQDPQNIILLLWNEGWVRAASIGAIPNQEEIVRNELGGYDYRDWELLEYSLVTIPANADALRRAYEAMEQNMELPGEVAAGRLIEKVLTTGSCEPEVVKTILTASVPQTVMLSAGELDGRVVSGEATVPLQWHLTTAGTETVSLAAPSPDDFEYEESFAKRRGRPPKSVEPETTEAAVYARFISTSTGEQSLVTFYRKSFEVGETETKLFIEPSGGITEMPHPDAGKTVEYKYASFAPPIIVPNQGQVHRISARMPITDEELLDKYLGSEHVEATLDKIEVQRAISIFGKYAASDGVCAITDFNTALAKRMFRRALLVKEEMDEIVEQRLAMLKKSLEKKSETPIERQEEAKPVDLELEFIKRLLV